MSYAGQVSPDGRWAWDGGGWVPRPAGPAGQPTGAGSGGAPLLVLALLVGLGVITTKVVEFVVYRGQIRSGTFFDEGVPYFYTDAYVWGMVAAGALGVLLAGLGAATSRGVGRGLAISALLFAGVGCGTTALAGLYSLI